MTTLRELPNSNDLLDKFSKYYTRATPSLDLDVEVVMAYAWENYDFDLVEELEKSGVNFNEFSEKTKKFLKDRENWRNQPGEINVSESKKQKEKLLEYIQRGGNLALLTPSLKILFDYVIFEGAFQDYRPSGSYKHSPLGRSKNSFKMFDEEGNLIGTYTQQEMDLWVESLLVKCIENLKINSDGTLILNLPKKDELPSIGTASENAVAGDMLRFLLNIKNIVTTHALR